MAMTTAVSARLTKRAAVHEPGPLGEIKEKRHGQDGFSVGGFHDRHVQQPLERSATDPGVHGKSVGAGEGLVLFHFIRGLKDQDLRYSLFVTARFISEGPVSLFSSFFNRLPLRIRMRLLIFCIMLKAKEGSLFILPLNS